MRIKTCITFESRFKITIVIEFVNTCKKQKGKRKKPCVTEIRKLLLL